MSAAGRRAARLAAVQALYQLEISGKGLLEVVAEFGTSWLGAEIEGEELAPLDMPFFQDLVAGTVREQRAIDRRVDEVLAKGWPLQRVEAVIRAILRVGAYELMFRRDVPPRAALSEYVVVARAFYEGDETGLVNAVLDAIARTERADELAARAG